MMALAKAKAKVSSAGPASGKATLRHYALARLVSRPHATIARALATLPMSAHLREVVHLVSRARAKERVGESMGKARGHMARARDHMAKARDMESMEARARDMGTKARVRECMM